MAGAVSPSRVSFASIHDVDDLARGAAAVSPFAIASITRWTYVRENDDQRRALRSDEPVSHQWATVGQVSSQAYSARTLRWATVSWFFGVCGAVELPR